MQLALKYHRVRKTQLFHGGELKANVWLDKDQVEFTVVLKLFLFLANVNYQSIDDSTQLPFLSIFLIPIEVLDFHSAYVPKELNHIFCKL